jgi:hypothetical protein
MAGITSVFRTRYMNANHCTWTLHYSSTGLFFLLGLRNMDIGVVRIFTQKVLYEDGGNEC